MLVALFFGRPLRMPVMKVDVNAIDVTTNGNGSSNDCVGGWLAFGAGYMSK